MLVPDVNVLVYAHRLDAPRHADARTWLEQAVAGAEPVGLSELVMSGFLRIVTNHRVFVDPTPPADALDFCSAVMRFPGVVPLRAGARHWPIFAGLCSALDARGNAVPDAFHAALAMENGATWVTTDHGFARFSGLKWSLLPSS
jgi:toxin-antitoxin system PIN domain toxin